MLDNLKSKTRQEAASASQVPTDVVSAHRSARRKRICIIGGGSISQNPRVVKEADALAAAGHDVVVLFAQQHAWAAMDRQILEHAAWKADIVEVRPSVGGRLRKAAFALQLRAFRLLCRLTTRFPVAELAYGRYFFPLLWRAIRHRSDLYIGHYTANLPVVAWAARWTAAKFGFDFEDFHRGEPDAVHAGRLPYTLIAPLEDRYLPAASFVTAASWAIAEEVARTTGLPTPTTVLNVFPLSDRAKLPASDTQPPNAPLSLYWFSQIVSLDRGLQDVIEAMALMRGQCELHIRGVDGGDSIDALRRLAQERGVDARIHFHPLMPPGELLASAIRHDVGLCLEVPATPNKDACISNKIFLFMLAGLAIAASRTRGQMDVLAATPDVGALYDSGDAAGLATILDRYASDRGLLARTKATALAAAQERWNWERESGLVVSAVQALA